MADEHQHPRIAAQHVELLAYTHFERPSSLGPWRRWVIDKYDGPGDVARPNPERTGQELIEFAGRACYQSWNNPMGRTTAGYIRNLLAQGHLSVIEHASASFLFAGVSRSLTHELVRHRHLSYSQLSQRYVNEAEAAYVIPVALQGDKEAEGILAEVMDGAQGFYEDLVGLLTDKLSHITDRTARIKMARGAARAVLPNMTETQIIVSGNYRAWRHFLRMRGAAAAESEIRQVAIKVWHILNGIAPAVFGDFALRAVDGTDEQELVTELTAG